MIGDAAAGTGPRYVALGDSMSIDAYAGGPGRGAASLLHRNRDGDFPDWAGRDLSTAGYGLDDLTRDGATAPSVLGGQLRHMTAGADLVTLTVGGNDLMGAYGRTSAASAVIDEVVATVDRILGQVRDLARGDAAIIVTTVYDPSDGTGAVPGSDLPPWPAGSELVRRLNTGLSALAGRHAALVADAHAHFHGHGVAAGDPSQPASHPDNRQLWYCDVIEPNAWGAHELRCLWWRTLAEAGRLP